MREWEEDILAFDVSKACDCVEGRTVAQDGALWCRGGCVKVE